MVTEFRYLVDDLAHTLKTPLTVLKNLAKQSNFSRSEARVVDEQTEQMGISLQHYLERAAGRTAQALVTPITVLPILHRITASIKKIYPAVSITVSPTVTTGIQVRVAEADLYEIIGNLLDNACKYGATEVWVSADEALRQIWIDDNGPGFAATTIEQITDRGFRADSSVAGQGLGLASSRERLLAYGGSLHLGKSEANGAQVLLDFP